jgi:prevent-host-death family protein
MREPGSLDPEEGAERGVRVEEIPISKFRTTCLAVLERVRKTRRPVLVTRFGQPVAVVTPPSLPQRRQSWLGAMAGTGTIKGDIVGPAADERDWDVLRR